MDDIPETPLPHPHAHSVAHAHPPQRVTVTDSALHWAKISDDAWQGLRGDGLRLVRVDVEDAPGDSRRRECITSSNRNDIVGFEIDVLDNDQERSIILPSSLVRYLDSWRSS